MQITTYVPDSRVTAMLVLPRELQKQLQPGSSLSAQRFHLGWGLHLLQKAHHLPGMPKAASGAGQTELRSPQDLP